MLRTLVVTALAKAIVTVVGMNFWLPEKKLERCAQHCSKRSCEAGNTP